MLLGTWLQAIRLNNAVNYFDINKTSEGFCLKLLNLVFNYKLKDLNDEKPNYPGIDLGDRENSKIAFQVTSRTDAAKIFSALKLIVANGDQEQFSNGIKFLILNQDKKITFSKKNNPQQIIASFDNADDLIYPEKIVQRIQKVYRENQEQFVLIKELLEKEIGHPLQQASSAAILNLNLELQLGKKELENEVEELRRNVVPKLGLTPMEISEINSFVEIYNTLLEGAFKIIKNSLYYNYFKIGIGIVRYEKDNYSFLLFPVSYTTNEPLIKRIKRDGSFDIGKAFMMGTALVLQSSSVNIIKEQPTKLAYGRIKEDFGRAFKQYQFPIHDDFVINEYLASFVDTFYVILGFQGGQSTYPLADLKFIINEVWPIWLDSILNINPELHEINYDIDGFQNRKDTTEHVRQFEIAKDRAKAGDIAAIKVIPTSELYNIALVNYFIEYQERKGHQTTTRVYEQGQAGRHITGAVWSSWNIDIMIKNLRIFFQNFARIYDQFIGEYFPLLAKELDLFDDGNTLIFLLTKDHQLTHGPQIEYFKLRSVAYKPNSIYFYLSDEADNPIDKSIFATGEVWTRTIPVNGRRYHLVEAGMGNITFISSKLPSYFLIKQMVAKKVEQYLKHKA